MANDDISGLKIERDKTAGYLRGKKRASYAIVGVVIAVIALILYLSGFFTPSINVEAVTVSQMYPSQSFTLLNASGYVVAQRKAAVASKVTGRLISLTVEEGNSLKKGQIIGRLENEDVLALEKQASANLNAAGFNLNQAEAELQDAALTFKRNQELLRHGYISQAEYDSGEARYKRAIAMKESAQASVIAAKAALQVAQLNVEYTFIRAPFDGVVLTKNADVGDIVTPIGAAANAKAALVTMADMSSLQAEVDVSESNLRQIRIGQPCEILLDALPDSRFSGVVHMIVPTADRSKASVLVKVGFIDKDKRMLPEMSAKVAFLEREAGADEKKPLTTINSSAIIERNGKKYVFLIKDGRALETQITTGASIKEMTEVIDGVKIGDRIALKPLDKLRNGSRVKTAEK
jgi:RND family efflux transporter MFP subunit